MLHSDKLTEETEMRTQHKTILTRDSVRISVREYGNSNADNTVTFLHGLCLNKDSWNLQAEQLVAEWGDDVRVITLDHRGHGESDTADHRTYTVRQLALDLADVLSALHVRGNVTLVGHSIGGMTIMEYLALPADERPVDPDHIALVATSPGNLVSSGVGKLLDIQAVHTAKHVLDFIPGHIIDPIMKAALTPLIGVVMRAVGYSDSYDEVMATVSTDAVSSTPLRTKIGFALALKDFDARESLTEITAETVIFSGGMDFLTPPAHSDLMEQMIPGARREHFPNLGHMILHEVPDVIISTLNKFVANARTLAYAS